MGMITLDSSKVSSYVTPYLISTINNIEECYNISIMLKKVLPQSFHYTKVTNEISDDIYYLKRELKTTRKNIINKVERIEQIESKTSSKLSDIAKSSLPNLFLRTSSNSILRTGSNSFISTNNSVNKKYNVNTFANLTDKQYNLLASLNGKFVAEPNVFVVGKDIGEIKDELSGFEVVEVIKDKYDYSALVLKDNFGNYTIVYPCTKKSKDDMIYDAYLLLEKYVSEYKQLDLNSLLILLKSILGDKIENFIGEFDNFSDFYNYAKDVYIYQRNQASKLAEKYYKLAESEGTYLNFSGFSKGGGMSEFAYLHCLDKFENADVLGNIVVYNPYHDSLNESEVNKLKNSGDLSVYRNQGDFVSMVFNESDFDEETTTIKCDWESLYDKPKTDKLTNLNIPVVSGCWSIIKNKNSFKSIFNNSPHSPGSASYDAFDSDGNAISAKKIDYSTVSKRLFGVNDVAKYAEYGMGVLTGAGCIVDRISNWVNLGMDVFDYGKSLYDTCAKWSKKSFSIKNMFGFYGDIFKETFNFGSDTANFFVRKFKNNLDKIKWKFGSVNKGAKSVLNWIDDKVGIVPDWFKEKANTAANWVSDKWESAVDTVTEIKDTATTWVKDKANTAANWVSDGWNSTVKFVSGIFGL